MTARRDSQARGHLLPGYSYFEYQRIVCTEVVLPWLERRVELTRGVVADFGAHQGGMVDALRESGRVAGAVGFELEADIVATSPLVPDERFRLERADVLALGPGREKFDLVLLHDVLEHIPDYERALDAVRSSLSEDGHVFVSFPPYYSSFGGHQQYARGLARLTPFVHLLPAGLFFRVARPGEQEYMTADGAYEDMVSVRGTRLTLGAAERAFAMAKLEVVDRELYLVRPEYTVRYRLKTRGAGVLGKLPGVREISVNGAFYLLRKAS